MSFIDDPEEVRVRAAEMRERADRALYPETKDGLLRIAAISMCWPDELNSGWRTGNNWRIPIKQRLLSPRAIRLRCMNPPRGSVSIRPVADIGFEHGSNAP